MKIFKSYKIIAIVLLFNQLIGAKAQNLTDSISTFKYKIFAGPSSVQLQADQLLYSNHSIFLGNDGNLINGGVILGEVIYDVKHSPISFVGDVSHTRFNLSMQQYDSLGNLKNESWFRNLSFTSVGLGILIEGKYVFAGAKYKLGLISGGINADSKPYNPEIVKNGAINLKSNSYSNMELTVGAKYEKFNLAFIWGLPISKPVDVGNGWSSSFYTASVVFGVTIDGKPNKNKSHQ